MTARSVPKSFPNSVKFEVSYSPDHPHPSHSHKKGQPPTAITTLFIQKEPSISERSEDGATLNTRVQVLQHVVGPDAEDTRLTWEELETLGKLFIAFARDKRMKSQPYFVPEQRTPLAFSSVVSAHRTIQPAATSAPGHRRMHSPLSSLTLASGPHTSAFHPGPLDGNTGTARERFAALTAKREVLLSSARPVLPPALGRQPPIKQDDPQPKRAATPHRRDATPAKRRDDRDRSDDEYSRNSRDSWDSQDGSVVSRRRDSRDAEDDRPRSGHKTRSKKNRD